MQTHVPVSKIPSAKALSYEVPVRLSRPRHNVKL